MLETQEVSIFIVEDDAHFRETFIDVMSLRGVQVRGAGSGLEGLSELREARPSVIILDVQLPDMHGFDLCRRIRRIETLSKTPIIFVSAAAQYSDPRDRIEGLLAGATVFLTKPISVEKLWGEIDALIRRD